MTRQPFVFFNTKTGTKEPFSPLDPASVKIYSCGPTVYNYAHLGNIRSFLFVDVLRRSLLLGGYTLDQSMNITDIDDKIITAAIEQKKSIQEFTKPWTDAFFEDLKTAFILPLEHYPRATESIDEMVHMVEKLRENGLVYERDGSLYFSIQKFASYGGLSKIDVTGMKSGTRYDTDEYTKEDIRDFVLWKNPKLAGETVWDTSLGKGRPGWHLECSAMIRKIYKSGVDIHTGGIDLLFPHHENEIAQSEGAYPGESFVSVWLHCEHLLVNGEKMAKSKGNFYTLRDILQLGYSPEQIRFYLISAHYRSKLNFSLDKLTESKVVMDKIQNTLNRILERTNKSEHLPTTNGSFQVDTHVFVPELPFIEEGYSQFLRALADDLNTPKALASVFETMKKINTFLDQVTISDSNNKELLRYFAKINSLFGVLSFESANTQNTEDSSWIEEEIQKRANAKKDKDFATADRIRRQLEEKGILLLDTKEGKTIWKKNH